MPRILVADDNTNIQRMVTLALQERGIEVTAVGNGEAAVRRIPDLNPDLVLADIFMPVRNGYELCEWVKKDPKFSHIPVILLVGAFDPLDEKEARRVGADGVLKKPFIPPDPLIAMVTAALEKSLKVAAEVNKPKEVATVAAVPLTIVAVELPPKIELPPLPEFPDPNPDEAAMVYAYGTARRSLDALDDAEAKAPRADEDEDAGDFDGASTTKDWRRSAMDFEVPQETACRPAFSAVEDLDSSFPSERDVVPLQVQVADDAKEIEHVPQQELEATSEIPSDWNVSVAGEAAGIPLDASQPDVVDLAEQSAVAIEPGFDVESGASGTVDPASIETPTAISESATNSESNFTSKATHWMDLIASPADPPQHDWFASTIQPHAKAALPEESALSAEAESQTEGSATFQEFAPTATALAAVSVAESTPVDQHEPFFADEEGATEKNETLVAVPMNDLAVPGPESSGRPEGDLSIEPHAVETAEQEPVAEPASMQLGSSEVIEEVAQETPSIREMDLLEPPAVHVTPEPLLVQEVMQRSAGYGATREEIPPTHSFLLPTQEVGAVEGRICDNLPAKNSDSKNFVEHPLFASESETLDFSHRSELAAAALNFPSPEFRSRTPSTSSPMREVLDEIPFLNPPSDFSKYVETRNTHHEDPVDAATVDAVVEKVLRKLEPQLRELFSQSVLRPLIENLLQNETVKKEH